MLEKTELANTDAPHEAAAKGTGAAEHAQIPALDGLRAIAVTGVILFHIYPPLLPGGFTGVDVFFVLSGLLITSIILHDIKARCFSFKEFYLRRIQRLLPNAIVTLVATLFLLAFFLPAGLEVFTAKHGLWTLFNLSNVYTWVRHGGYWAGTSDWAFLTHFWSLAIEEQYYLLFPFALVIGVHFCFPKIRKFIVLATVLSLGLCLWGSYNRAAATFYLLPTRVWELLLGSALAASGISIYNYSPIVRKLSRVKCELLGWGGCALILASFFFLSGEMKFPGWVVLFPVAGSAFVLFSVMLGESSFSRLLATMPFRGIGRVSYSLYLWHWPLIIFGKLQAELHGYSHITGAVCGGVASIFAGTAAYWCVERPLRRRGVGRGKRLALIGAGFAGAVACCVYLGNRPFRTFPQFDPVTVSGGYYSFRSPQKTKKISFHIPEKITTYDVGYKEPLMKAEEMILEGGGLLRLHGGGRVPRVVLSGSSHADMYARVIDEVCLEKGVPVAFFNRAAEPPFELTSPMLPEERIKAIKEFDEYRMRFIKEWRPDVLFLIERWDRWYVWNKGNVAPFEEQFEAFLQKMHPLGTKVVFVTQAPVSPVGSRMNFRAIASLLQKPDGRLPVFYPDAWADSAHASIHAAAERVAAKNPNLLVIRSHFAFLNTNGSLRYADGRKFFYLDEDHLTDAGTEELRPLLEKVIADQVKH